MSSISKLHSSTFSKHRFFKPRNTLANLTNFKRPIQNPLKNQFQFSNSPFEFQLLLTQNFSSSRFTTQDVQKRSISELSYKELPKTTLLSTVSPVKTSKFKQFLLLARVDKPIGTMLLLWPCVWSIGMASFHLNVPLSTTFYTLGVFSAGAFIMRGAGCTINDLWDIKIDRQVARTQQRPLASGAIKPHEAIAFLGIQLSAGLAILVQLNTYSIVLGASSLALVTIYPLMKRITYWPQFVLGLAFNWGALLGWSAIAGSSDWVVTLPLYAAGVCWTLVYDTIYAHQDKVDDKKAGVKSTALLLGPNTKKYLSAFSVTSLSLLSLSGYLNGHSFIFPLSVAAAGGYLAWDLRYVNLNNPNSCWKHFNRQQIFGALITTGIYSDLLLLNCV